MKKNLGCLFIGTALALSLSTGALATDTTALTDLTGHWAQSAITQAVSDGLFSGTSDTEFSPESSLTRGMFVTVLGRLSGVDPSQYQDWYLGNLYSDVKSDAYYAPYVNWATRYGIAGGAGNGTFAPDEPITREQMATMLIRFASIYNYELTSVSNSAANSFFDTDQISAFAQSAVDSLRSTGILSGTQNEDGTYSFSPQATATRAMGAVVIERLKSSMQPYTGRELVNPTGIYVSATTSELYVGDYTTLSATVLPADATNQTVTWVSSDPSVVTVDRSGTVTAVGEGTASVYGYTLNGEYQSCSFTCTRNTSLAYGGESYDDKCIRIYGQVVDDPRTFYDSAASNYEKSTDHLVEVTVPAWDFTDSTYTTKYTKYITLEVNENIADTVKAIFEEIYNGDEQFPIDTAGGYYESFKSEHHPGLAIDINPDSNYYCSADGTAITGSDWDPENDPYSIPVGGDVDQAFAKYGFTRGIYWRCGTKDYMHYSFFGT